MFRFNINEINVITSMSLTTLIVNSEHIFIPNSSVLIVDFEQVIFAEIVRYFSSFTKKKISPCVSQNILTTF